MWLKAAYVNGWIRDAMTRTDSPKYQYVSDPQAKPRRAVKRSPWSAVVALIAVGVVGFFGTGATMALWSSSEDVGQAVIQVGDLSIEMNHGFSWQATVWTDPQKLPVDMRYESTQPDGSGLIGEVVSGVNSPIPMGGDWMTLDLSFTGDLTKTGDNLNAEMDLIPRDLTGGAYTIIIGNKTWQFQADEDITVPLTEVMGTNLPIEVVIHLRGDGLGIYPQVKAEEPGTIDFTDLFDVHVRQVR